MSAVKKHRLLRTIITLLAVTIYSDNLHAEWATNSRNDPFKLFSAIWPHYFLYQREKQLMFGYADEKGTPERVMVAISAFGQNATNAKTLAGTYCKPQNFVNNTCPGECNTVTCSNPSPIPGTCPNPPCTNEVNIGDIDGRWNLLGLLAGKLPQGASFPPLLLAALQALFPGVQQGDVTSAMIELTNEDPTCHPLFGYVSVPLKYRKRGVRWNIESIICGDFGLQFEGGVVEISQVLNPCFINLTNQSDADASLCQANSNVSKSNINCFLFDPLVPLMKQLGLDICNFTKWGVEDMYLSLYWRHAHVVNFNRDLSWARLLAIPFIRIGGGIATGHTKDTLRQFSLPFGNNGSNSFNANIGIDFDFVETIEIGGEIGYSHFFSKNFDNYRLPTNVLQSGIFPFATSVSVKPGDTVYLAGKMHAYHFLERLSFWFQWVYVHHRKDTITRLVDDPAFIQIDDNNPLAKCPNTVWRAQLGNFGFYYDVSPNLQFGFVWQQMFHARNVYNATTCLFTVNFIF